MSSVQVFTKAEMDDRRESSFFHRMNAKSDQAQFEQEVDETNQRLHKLRLRYKKARWCFWMLAAALVLTALLTIGVYKATMAGLIAPVLFTWLLPIGCISGGWLANSTWQAGHRLDNAKKRLTRR